MTTEFINGVWSVGCVDDFARGLGRKDQFFELNSCLLMVFKSRQLDLAQYNLDYNQKNNFSDFCCKLEYFL